MVVDRVLANRSEHLGRAVCWNVRPGGGDKGASGALVRAESIEVVQRAVDTAYPRSHPEFADKYAVHICKVVDGIRVYEGPL